MIICFKSTPSFNITRFKIGVYHGVGRCTDTQCLLYPRSAQVAQEKYSQQTSHERYAYITMIAFTALALVANIFLVPAVLPMTLLVFDMAILSAASSLVLPYVMNLFAMLPSQGPRRQRDSHRCQAPRAPRHGTSGFIPRISQPRHRQQKPYLSRNPASS